jgi:NTP pyrophosphatase (non-canonical NTP hydrolase)
MTNEERILLQAGVAQLVKTCHGRSVEGGWWTDPATLEPLELTVERALSKLALIHSEVSEATEGFRKDTNDDHLKHRKMAEVELADAIIRIADLAGKAGFDLAGAILEKLDYNAQRADHKLENRMKDGGKKA